MPARRTKREEAQLELEKAELALGRCLSLLGGRTRYKPKGGPDATYIARQYLESMLARGHVVSILLAAPSKAKLSAQASGEPPLGMYLP